MLLNFTHVISMIIWGFSQVLAVAICIFCASFLFKKSFENIFYLFNLRKINKQGKNLSISEKTYYQFCHIIASLIEIIKDEPMKKEYIQTFNMLRKEFWEGQHGKN